MGTTTALTTTCTTLTPAGLILQVADAEEIASGLVDERDDPASLHSTYDQQPPTRIGWDWTEKARVTNDA